jgi:hypothetical protein
LKPPRRPRSIVSRCARGDGFEPTLTWTTMSGGGGGWDTKRVKK